MNCDAKYVSFCTVLSFTQIFVVNNVTITLLIFIVIDVHVHAHVPMWVTYASAIFLFNLTQCLVDLLAVLFGDYTMYMCVNSMLYSFAASPTSLCPVSIFISPSTCKQEIQMFNIYVELVIKLSLHVLLLYCNPRCTWNDSYFSYCG